jgi:YD repeat-containing protein
MLQLTSQTGVNGETVSFGYDASSRPASTTSPYGSVTNNTYSATAPHVKSTTGSHWTKGYLDGFGRTVKTESGYTQSGADTVVSTVETEYDMCACSPLGKVKRVSRPYGPGQTPVWTEYVYDALGRTIEVKPPANSGAGYGISTTYSYAGNWVTVTQPGGRYKRYYVDAFGNLIFVAEPRPGGSEYGTGYGYTPLNQLETVNLGATE